MKLFNETFARILSALVLLPLYFFCIYTETLWNIPILLVSLVVSLASLYEFFQITSMKNSEGASCGTPFVAVGSLAAFAVNILFFIYSFGKVIGLGSFVATDFRFFTALIAIFLLIIMALQIFRRPIEGGIYSLSITVFGVIFIAVSFAHIIFLKALPNAFFYIFALHAVVMINDSAAYFGGVLFGRHKAGLKVSPNKSWEGYFSGMLFSIIAMIVINNIYITFWDKTLFTTLEAGFLGAFFSVSGNLGDLIESAIKRDGGVKDSGRLIPGHGGMWDAFDALIFSMPLFYYYLKIKGI